MLKPHNKLRRLKERVTDLRQPRIHTKTVTRNTEPRREKEGVALQESIWQSFFIMNSFFENGDKGNGGLSSFDALSDFCTWYIVYPFICLFESGKGRGKTT
ncbi:uncharacterized protein RHO17_013743 isoform 2-T11 [Thomomys bottae]